MNKNKLVIAMTAAALLSSAGVMAADNDAFQIEYLVSDDIIITTYDQDVDLTNDGTFDADGALLGKIEFCVGVSGATSSVPVGYDLRVNTLNGGNLSDGTSEYPYALHYATDESAAFPDNAAIVLDQFFTADTTELTETGCTGDTNDAMWVKVASANLPSTAGTYTDTVTMIVAPRS